MSNLRILGIIIGLIGLLLSFRMFRGQKWNRFNFVLLASFGFMLFIISLNPDLLNIMRRMMNLEETERGRIIVLLVCSNIALWFIIIYTRTALVEQRLQFDKLVRMISADKIQGNIDRELADAKIAVLIPAYNEAENLRELLPKFPGEILGNKLVVFVVDDGSNDNTYFSVMESGFCAVRNPFNRGGGAALRLGYDILNRAGVDICVTMDADGQHDPEEIPQLLHPILDDHADIVIGSRILGKREKDNLLRLMGVYFFGFIINRLTGTRITDPSSGFRAFKIKALSSVFLYEDQYHTSELIVKAAKNGLRITEVPITISKRKYGKSKKGKDWKYGIHFAKTIIRSWWK